MSTDTDNQPAAASLAASAADSGQPAAPAAPELLADLVIANRILFRQRVVDAFGHVSVRHDKDPGRFLLARNMAPGLVRAEDIVEFDLDSRPVNAGGRKVYLERFIHGEIYRTRPEVMAVIHSHAPAVVPFGVVASVPLRAIWHMSGFLGSGVPIFEIRDTAGDASDLLIRSHALGKALAGSLGSNNVVLMRGHGATVVGSTLREAVFRAVYTQVNAELQLQAQQLGPVEFLTAGEAQAASESVGSQNERAWNLWKGEVEDSADDI
jgi:HCOMODA/2-hydroxy-3-carboxy-muconic semialdehyde decarboxylase